MAGDKAESNFDAVIGKAPTLLASIGRTFFDSKNGFDSGAMIAEMTSPAAAQRTLNISDGSNPPTFEA